MLICVLSMMCVYVAVFLTCVFGVFPMMCIRRLLTAVYFSLGNQKWSVNRGKASFSLCVFGDVVLVGSFQMKIAVFDIDTGLAFVCLMGDVVMLYGS